jgi:hypothetical protein
MSIISTDDILDIFYKTKLAFTFGNFLDKIPNSYGHTDEIYQKIMELENKGLIIKLQDKYSISKKGLEKYQFEQENLAFQKQKEQLDFEKSRTEHELNLKKLKDFKKTNIKSNIALGLSIVLVIVEIVKLLFNH